ncbi:hypothetical protein [Sphingomonas sp.]|uniref:hypothetical protein n=1 Tax=Sphingomonas sp. TaxID=28214 RepID=UPI003CC66D6C
MRWWCWLVIVFGAVLVGAACDLTDGPAVALMRWMGRAPIDATPPLRFAVGLMGAVTLGWGASLLAVAATSDALAPDLRVILWRRIGWAVLAWFTIDSIVSIATGFWPNAVSNTVLLAAFFAAARRV